MKFKIRASGAGQIMGIGGLGKTGETYCQTWLIEQLYARRKEFTSKYTDKGLIVEDNSLDYIAEVLDYGMLIKNDKFFEDEYFTGTPDIILKDHLIDVKNSWDCFTFPLFSSEVDRNYLMQAQVYMHLTGIKRYKLIYVLSDTPDHLIRKEAFYWCKNNGYDDLDDDIYQKFAQKMTYQNIDNKLKHKVFDIEYDGSIVEQIQERVKECRGIIDQLKKSFL